MSWSVQPDLAKELDEIRGDLIPRSRLVEMVLTKYVETKKKERSLQGASVVVQAPEALAAPVEYLVNPGVTPDDTDKY